MAIIPLPQKAEYQNLKDTSARLVIEPLYPGYGTTLGNLLRRVLLSSLHGVAVEKVRITSAEHEFTNLPHIKEDIVEIILNLKKIRLRANLELVEPISLKINASGDKQVTGADIETPSDVSVVNPDQLIATLTDKEAKLEMELTVTRGRGYVPVEMQDNENKEVGVISIDAQYNPVIKVGINIQNVRVDKMTNYDSLTLDIETDGTRDPQSAVKEAIDIISEQLNFIYTGGDSKTTGAGTESAPESSSDKTQANQSG